jgi:hypothetical protein
MDGIGVFPVSDVHEAVSRFEAGSTILLLGDGIAPSPQLVSAIAEEPEAVVATVPDDEVHEAFERIDGETRWAGIALVDSKTLGSTAAILGDWDLQSTLLRRTIQDGALRWRAAEHGGEPLLAERTEQLEAFQRQLVQGSRSARRDWASRFVLPPVEDLATHQLMRTSIRPSWLVWAALALTIGGAIAFSRGWLGTGLTMLGLSTPLDLIAGRLASIRLQPLPKASIARSLLWPAAGAAVLMLGWWKMRHGGSDWGVLVSAIAAIAFAEASRLEGSAGSPGELWVISRRNAILLAVPFAIFGTWTAYLIALFIYAAASFFFLQHARLIAAKVDPKLTEIG